MPPLRGDGEPRPRPDQPRAAAARRDASNGDGSNGDGSNGDGQDDHELLVRAVEAAGDPNDRLEQQPMIRYHAYHDTGLDITRDGRTLRVVRPGTAFGYFVDHEGDLDGWRDEVQGATPITDRFFRLDVPEEGTAVITTVVEAVEPGTRRGCFAFVGAIRRLIRRIMRALTGG
jgi:hypothetical protein